MTTLRHLEREGYRLEERWRTGDILRFVYREINAPAWPLRVAFASMTLLVGYATYRGLVDVRAGLTWWREIVLPFGLGAIAIAALVVPHELIHGLAFRALGARRVVYGADWRRLVFHAAAPGFAMRPRELRFVALAPFAIVTAPLAYVALAGPSWWSWLAIGALLMHTQGCLGDFAVVNYFARRPNRGGEVLTFDEEDGGSFVIVCRASDRQNDGA